MAAFDRNALIADVLGRQAALVDGVRKGALAGTAHYPGDRYAWVVGKDAGKLALANYGAADRGDVDDGAKAVGFTVSTAQEDRDGDVLHPRGVILDNYARNPVVFFGHQEWEIPIGVSRDPAGNLAVRPEAERIWAKCYFDVADPDADFIYGKVRRGVLSAASVSFVPVEAYRRDRSKALPRDQQGQAGWEFVRYDLTEWSVVGVPANAGAIRDALDREKSFISPRLAKGLGAYAARPRGKGFAGWLPQGGDVKTKGRRLNANRIGERVYVFGGEHRGKTGKVVDVDATESPPFVDFFKVQFDSGGTSLVQQANVLSEEQARRFGKIKSTQADTEAASTNFSGADMNKGASEDYQAGYERGRQRAEDEKKRTGKVQPVPVKGDDYDIGYARGWNSIAQGKSKSAITGNNCVTAKAAELSKLGYGGDDAAAVAFKLCKDGADGITGHAEVAASLGYKALNTTSGTEGGYTVDGERMEGVERKAGPVDTGRIRSILQQAGLQDFAVRDDGTSIRVGTHAADDPDGDANRAYQALRAAGLDARSGSGPVVNVYKSLTKSADDFGEDELVGEEANTDADPAGEVEAPAEEMDLESEYSTDMGGDEPKDEPSDDPAENLESVEDHLEEAEQAVAAGDPPLGARILAHVLQHVGSAMEYLDGATGGLEPEAKEAMGSVLSEGLAKYKEAVEGLAAERYPDHDLKALCASCKDAGTAAEPGFAEDKDGQYDFTEEQGEGAVTPESTQEILRRYQELKAKYGAVCKKLAEAVTRPARPRPPAAAARTLAETVAYLNDLGRDPAVGKRFQGGLKYHRDVLARLRKDFSVEGEGTPPAEAPPGPVQEEEEKVLVGGEVTIEPRNGKYAILDANTRDFLWAFDRPEWARDWATAQGYKVKRLVRPPVSKGEKVRAQDLKPGDQVTDGMGKTKVVARIDSDGRMLKISYTDGSILTGVVPASTFYDVQRKSADPAKKAAPPARLERKLADVEKLIFRMTGRRAANG